MAFWHGPWLARAKKMAGDAAFGYAAAVRQRERGGAPADPDDFVYHLHRGSSLLLADRVGDAKEELERALALQPADAKSQDLLAGVYYRLGVYPRAIELWSQLVETMPAEAALRVNLALVLIKTGQGEAARKHLRVALDIQPDHARAWGYLGLIHYREGRLREAREAFSRGGQSSMVRRVDDALSASSPAMSIPPTELEAHDRDAMRGAAEEALEQLKGGETALALARSLRRRRGSGAWSAVEPGEESSVSAAFSYPRPPAPSAGLDALVASWSAETDRVMGVIGDGLHIQSRQDVHARLGAMRLARGNVDARHLGEDSGFPPGTNPMWRLVGPVDVLIGSDKSITVVELRDEVFFVQETRLLAFDTQHQVAALPLGAEERVIVQLHGPGCIAFCSTGPICAFAVRPGEELRVDPARLVGWAGRLFPSGGRGTAPYAAVAPRLVLRGEGHVLLDQRAE